MSVDLQNEYNSLISDDLRSAIGVSAGFARGRHINIYLIGGVVRDLIMGQNIKDIDITLETDAVKFCRDMESGGLCKIISVQENLRTVKAQFKNNAVLDFASTRMESYPQQGRLPEAFGFGCDISLDVKRRDFTINTLAVSLIDEDKYSLIDYFDGYKDIKSKLLRILYDESFIDDPSRIIRALKFRQRFGFDIEEKTLKSMKEYLQNVNPDMPLERVKNELHQYFSLSGENILNDFVSFGAWKLLSDVQVPKVDNSRLAELKTRFKITDLWFCYLAIMIFNSSFAVSRLNLSRSQMQIIKDLKALTDSEIDENADNYRIYKTCVQKHELACALFYVITGNKAVLKYLTELRHIKVIASGQDLINLGLSPSKQFNGIFDSVLKEKLEGRLSSLGEELEFIRRHI